MKIERWAVVRKDGTVYSTYDIKDEAHCNARGIMGYVLLLTGELPEPKKTKKVRLAHALVRDNFGYCLSWYMFESEEEARKQCKNCSGLRWPAPVPDEGGFITIEVES